MKEVEILRSNIFFNIFLIIITLLVIVMLIIYYLEPFSQQTFLAKKEDAIRALNILENKTILEFYPVLDNEEISIACEERSRPSEDKSFFVAGEGGPTNITSAGLFNIIHKGEIF